MVTVENTPQSLANVPIVKEHSVRLVFKKEDIGAADVTGRLWPNTTGAALMVVTASCAFKHSG